jgi:hypothetical protein
MAENQWQGAAPAYLRALEEPTSPRSARGMPASVVCSVCGNSSHSTEAHRAANLKRVARDADELAPRSVAAARTTAPFRLVGSR